MEPVTAMRTAGFLVREVTGDSACSLLKSFRGDIRHSLASSAIGARRPARGRGAGLAWQVDPKGVRLDPDRVLPELRKHLLIDGFDLVLDLRASHGSTLVDARDGSTYLDMFSFFASNALGMN